MSKIFISHVEEDASFALELAHAMTKAGYAAWCYEVDSVPGRSHLDQTYEAIEASDAFVLVISPACAESHEVTTELTRAQDKNKPILPLLLGITHEDLMTQTKWGQRLGTIACLSISCEIGRLMPRLVRGLTSAGISGGPDSSDTFERLQQIDQELQRYRRPSPNAPVFDIPDEDDDPFAGEPTSARPGGKREKRFRFPGHAANLSGVASLVKNLLDSEQLDAQVVQERSGTIIQAKKHSFRSWKKYAHQALGLDRALTVRLVTTGDMLEVHIGDAVWIDKAVVGAVSVVVLWPLAVTASWGAYKQRQLQLLIQRNVEGFLADCA
jgi:hypothetical protein